MRNHRVLRNGAAVLASAAVAAIAIAGANHSTGDTAVAGGPGTPTASPQAVQQKAAQQKPVARPTVPPRPKEYPLPKDAVAACKRLLTDQPHPTRSAKPVARLDGAPGSIVVLADASHWAACDTAYARQNNEGSLREPSRIAASSKLAAFAVAHNLIPRGGKEYNYYWAAGVLPKDVTAVTYTFPDGATTKAVVQGNYWLLQHQDPKPWTPGSETTQRIIVKITKSNGTTRTEKLDWGTHTCAQITHGC
ncbi:hypothetical protein [Kribbella sp. NPDC051770]|uniref:hypothetical protein n=1 Tax=Kribbella sp. NPDC051770 TaxID=3155413 RepID=UPI003423537A